MSKPVDISVLMDLASAGPQDEFTETFGLNAEMQAALKEELARERQEKMQQAVKRIVSLMTDVKAVKEASVARIRAARQQEKEAKNYLDQIERAIAYASETSNYLPLIKLTQPAVRSQYELDSSNRDKFKIPEGWMPKAAEFEKPISKVTTTKIAIKPISNKK